MIAAIIQLWSRQPVRYLFTGGVLYIVDISTLLLLSRIFSFSPVLAVACSFWVAFIVSFVLQKYITFGNKTKDKKELGKQTFLYALLVLFNYAFTLLFVSFFTDLFGLVIARTIALLITVTWNYFAYRYIFR